MKNWENYKGSFARSLKVLRPKYEKDKKVFFVKKTPNCSSAHVICCFEETAEFFRHKQWKKRAQAPRKEQFWGTKNNQNVSHHILVTLWKKMLKFSLPKPQKSKLTVQKKAETPGKKYQKLLCTKKGKKWDFCRRGFAQLLKVSGSK